MRIESKQLELIRRNVTRIIGKSGKFWIFIFPNNTLTKKNEKSRMGKGAGSFDRWFYPICPGDSLVELEALAYSTALNILKICQKLLPVKLKLVSL
jgi:large subunit ribosomal protein L16